MIGTTAVTASVDPFGNPVAGTDARDIWVTHFVEPSGDVVGVYLSPTGLVLAVVRVPSEVAFMTGSDGSPVVWRTEADIRRFHESE